MITMMLMSFTLVTAEFLPSGILTQIAAGLEITTGQAGQMVAVTAFAGLLAAPTIGMLLPRLDRRSLMILMAVLAAVSNALVAIAPSLIVVLLSRFLLGVAISGFWAMSITVAARIVGPERIGRAVMFNAAGVSLATVAGVPLGVMLSESIGWRGTFGVAAAVSIALAVALRVMLPTVPAAGSASFSTLIAAIRRPGIGLGIVANVFVVSGHFLAYTYVRVALERTTEDGVAIGADTIVLLLAAFGLGGLIGNIAIGAIVDRAYRVLAVVTPLILSVLLLVVAADTGVLWLIAASVFAWGFFFASWLLIVNTWAANRMPDQLEAGGSLIVVGFQTGIMVAAAVGGLLVDGLGIVVVFAAGALLLLLGSVQFGIADRIAARRS
jgi:predicted MFS family arabinose efflux permease